jgi:hypothetical protein
MFSSFLISLVLSFLNEVATFNLLSLLSITVPGFAQYANRIILQFVYLDILQTDKWLTPYLDTFLDVLGLDSSEDAPLTDELDVLGYSSSSSLKSLGSFLVFFAFLLLQIIIVMLFFWCRQWICARYRQKIFWNGILGFFMQQSQTLTLSAAIGMMNEN